MLAGFDRVYLVDSTGFDLEPSLYQFFKGAGGSGSKSAMRIQLALDYLTQRIYVKIGDIKLGLDLLALLKENPESFSMPVCIKGSTYRMAGQRLPDGKVQERLRKENRTAANKGKSITDAYRLFLHYAIFITNLPESYNMDALYVRYRVRGQIELVFKTGKSILNIHAIRSAKFDRVMCEVYGKLILAVLTTHFAVQPEFDSISTLSLHRTMQWVKAMAMTWGLCHCTRIKRTQRICPHANRQYPALLQETFPAQQAYDRGQAT